MAAGVLGGWPALLILRRFLLSLAYDVCEVPFHHVQSCGLVVYEVRVWIACAVLYYWHGSTNADNR